MTELLPTLFRSIFTKITDEQLYVVISKFPIQIDKIRQALEYILMSQSQKSKRKPTELSDFQQFTEIGHGAFGKVYRAKHKTANKHFALKKISKKDIKAQNMITQLNNEIKISRQLDHPHIIKLYDTFDDGQHIYLVLELAQNGQLYSKIYREGKLDERTAKKMIKQVFQAVSYLHSRDPPIIHRDIKPQNILLDIKDRVKLADFGWSNFLNKPRKTYCGTVDYLAPEMIDKSGHDEKLDIWCLGVLTYELLTGRTPFVAQGSPQEPKSKGMQITRQNILDVKIDFPNDFPILAKSFILGMVKRKPEERMTIKQIMDHEWLTTNNNGGDIIELPQVIPKKRKDGPVPIIEAQEPNIVSSLNKRIRQLEQELTRVKQIADQAKGLADNAEHAALMKQLRKLRGIQQRNIQLQQDNQKYWGDISNKDKQIIELKGTIKTMQQNQQSIEKLKQDKKTLQDKVKKVEKQMQNIQVKNSQMSSELAGLSVSLAGRLARGDKVNLSEANSEEFLNLIKEQMETLEKAFDDSKHVLMKVLNKQKMTKDKEDELARLRIEKARLRQELKAELRDDFQQQKDRIIIDARNELSLQKQKWMSERAQLKKFYEQQSQSPASRGGPNLKEELQLQLKTIKELNLYNETTINEQRVRLRELQQEMRRKK